MWERGLKCDSLKLFQKSLAVAPLVGAWIEITFQADYSAWVKVAPLVGAWIEIPSLNPNWDGVTVAPLVGAWIEILNLQSMNGIRCRRSPCGSVD